MGMCTLLCIVLLSFCGSCFGAVPAAPPNSSGLLGLKICIDQEPVKECAASYSIRENGAPLFTGSKEACLSERLRLLRERHGTGRINMRAPTLGGKQYWADCYIKNGWRIQQHLGTKHYRLLNERDLRYAWGSYEACRLVLAIEHFNSGLLDQVKQKAVVLLHGIVRSKDSLAIPVQHLQAAGYECLNINYPSRIGSIDEFSQQVHGILNKRPDISEVSFVTHSMGGLILRKVLADTTQPWRQQMTLKNAVLMFAPNQGAHKANLWHKKWWYQCIFGPAGEELTSEHAQALPLLPMHTGIIIGQQLSETGKSRIIPGNDDGTVGVEECKLAGVKHYAYHPVGHTYGMNKEPVLADIVSFVNDGVFKSQN